MRAVLGRRERPPAPTTLIHVFSEPGAEPTAEQRRLPETIGSIFLEHHKWPNWAWVDEVLEREVLAADAVLASMPRDPTFNYSFVSWPFARAPEPAHHVKLIIAGFRRLEAASVLVTDRCALISTLGAIRANVQLDPFDTGWPRTTMKAVSHRLYASRHMPPGAPGRVSPDSGSTSCGSVRSSVSTAGTIVNHARGGRLESGHGRQRGL